MKRLNNRDSTVKASIKDPNNKVRNILFTLKRLVNFSSKLPSEVTGSFAVLGIANFPAAMAACSWWRRYSREVLGLHFAGVLNGPVLRAAVLPGSFSGVSAQRHLELSYATAFSHQAHYPHLQPWKHL